MKCKGLIIFLFKKMSLVLCSFFLVINLVIKKNTTIKSFSFFKCSYLLKVIYNVLEKFIFGIILLFFNICFFAKLFIYTYYITFYIILVSITVVLKFFYMNLSNAGVKSFLLNIILFNFIILMNAPIAFILSFYVIHRN